MGDAELTGVQPAVQKKRLIFNALTQAKVIDITFNETEKKPAPRSEDTQIRVNARVQMKLLAPIEGQEEFFTNYGLSIFEKKTGEKTLYWGKTATDAMTLRDLVSDASGIPKEQMDLIKLKNYLVGKTVYCKSENRSNPTDGSTVSKALIKQIKMD